MHSLTAKHHTVALRRQAAVTRFHQHRFTVQDFLTALQDFLFQALHRLFCIERQVRTEQHIILGEQIAQRVTGQAERLLAEHVKPGTGNAIVLQRCKQRSLIDNGAA